MTSREEFMKFAFGRREEVKDDCEVVSDWKIRLDTWCWTEAHFAYIG